MATDDRYSMVNPQNGNRAFSMFAFDDPSCFEAVQRLTCFSLILWNGGRATLTADFAKQAISGNLMLAFSPYQPFRIEAREAAKGWVIQFHPEFFCIFRHHEEIAANGLLFNNSYQPPYVQLTLQEVAHVEGLIQHMAAETQKAELAQHDLLISYLKIVLITMARLKINQYPNVNAATGESKDPFVLQKLKEAIEQHYRTNHSPSFYADLLNISPKALAKIIRHHVGKTLTNLISDRIVIEAKRELYLTPRSIKEIAYELGFDDEFYFSRFFKRNASVAPQLYRETVGFNRADSLPVFT